MLSYGPEVVAALRTHQEGRTEATSFYLGAVTKTTFPVESGSLRFAADGRVQASGRVDLVGQGESFVPRWRTDVLAPTGQELSLRRVVPVGGVEVEIPLGRYRITKSSDAQFATRGDVSTGWGVSLTVADRFEMLDADDFLAPESPPENATVWGEIRRLSPIPVQESLPDVSVPRTTVYRSRLDAIITVADLMGGVPHLTREGVLTVRRKDAWLTDTVPAFSIPGVIDWQDEMSNSFFNQVAVRSSLNNDLVAYRAMTDDSNPLSVGRAGGRTYSYASPVLETQAAVDAAADTVLARVLSKRSRPLTVTCGPEALLLELGDYGTVTDPRTGRSATGEVSGMTVPFDPTAGVQVELIVAEES